VIRYIIGIIQKRINHNKNDDEIKLQQIRKNTLLPGIDEGISLMTLFSSTLHLWGADYSKITLSNKCILKSKKKSLRLAFV
jgi:hypothetical protein